MKKHDQRSADDALRACVATVFGTAYEKAPVLAGWRGGPEADWGARKELRAWLLERCLGLEVLPHGEIPWGFAVAFGTSPRGDEHAVVVCGEDLHWDPHPSRAGLAECRFYWAFTVVEPSFVLGGVEILRDKLDLIPPHTAPRGGASSGRS